MIYKFGDTVPASKAKTTDFFRIPKGIRFNIAFSGESLKEIECVST